MYTNLVRAVLGLAITLFSAPVVADRFQQSPAPAEVTRPSFSEFLTGIRTEALSRGIREEIVTAALADIAEPAAVVLERDRAQAEAVLSLETYIARRLSRTTVRTGRQMLARHRKVLTEIESKYGVPSRLITAIWGIESNFGRFSGVRPTVPALATLAWDPRRSALFRRELFDALEILNRGDIELAKMQGSWAGAMGQPQFMPSSYLNYAEDYDGDGKRDIWGSQADIFASIANYLKGHGWKPRLRWGREVSVPRKLAEQITADVARRNGSCGARRSMTVALRLDEWQKMGVRLPGGGALPTADQRASLVSGRSRHFLVYDNYDAILEYNCAHAYAISVALLADAIGG
jgi:membrane-bound lytic murein transglycosylase B